MLAPFVHVPQKHDFVTPNFYFCHSKLSPQLSLQTRFCPPFCPSLVTPTLAPSDPHPELICPHPEPILRRYPPSASTGISPPSYGVLMPSQGPSNPIPHNPPNPSYNAL